jgi:acyl-CoA synthetase (AMP-forming)/AMP-acid ligase II
VIRTGAVAVPLDIQLDDEDLAHILSDSEARAVITTRRRVARIERLSSRQKARLIVLDAGQEDEQSWQGFLLEEATEIRTSTPNEPAVIQNWSSTPSPLQRFEHRARTPRSHPIEERKSPANLPADQKPANHTAAPGVRRVTRRTPKF